MHNCKYCNKEFKSRRGLRYHKLRHHQDIYLRDLDRETTYLTNPKVCAGCKISLPYKQRHNKFCTQSCAASYNNIVRPRKPKRLSPVKIKKKYVKKEYDGYKNSKYTFDLVSSAVAASRSIAGALTILGLKPKGNNYHTLKKHLQRLDINTDHWLGQSWSKNEQLKNWSDYARSGSVRKQLIKQLGNKCQECGITEWRNHPLSIEMDHIDGDRTNNNVTNLKLLCPNCHSITPTWKGKKRL